MFYFEFSQMGQALSREDNQVILKAAKKCDFPEDVREYLRDWEEKGFWNKTSDEIKVVYENQ